MKKLFLCFCLNSLALTAFSQQTVGTLLNTSGSYDGYTLFAPMSSNTTYLIDNCGQLINSWEATDSPALSAYLLEDGNLLRTLRTNNQTFTAGGKGGAVQLFDWDGNLQWEYEVSSTTECHHHDVEYLPNGNVLMIVWDNKTSAEGTQAGRNTGFLPSSFWPDKIIEIEPTGSNGGTIVWEWHAWDHLIQDFDQTKDNYGVVANHPELIDLNYPLANQSDWLHINSVDYNAEFDQIVLSVHNTSELWIIDHSTTTQEAAGHSGGNFGKGGDLLYRWGNPAAYDRAGDKQFYAQHDARWITEGADIGKLMVFNNGKNRTPNEYSTVDIIDPPVDGNGNYTPPTSGNGYLPASPHWTYMDNPNTNFYSSNISGAHRLPNDNTLICEGSSGHLFEVDTDGNMVWEYQTPVGNNGPVEQGTQLTNGNSIFRCTRYGANYAGFVGRDLTPGDLIELNSQYTCDLFENPTGINIPDNQPSINIYPNPTSGYFQIDGLLVGETITVRDAIGRKIISREARTQFEIFNTSYWSKGVYFVNVGRRTTKLICH